MDHIGANCSLESCGRHDFLPITCHFCKEVFCENHSHTDAHKCSKIPDLSSSLPPMPAYSSEKCSIDGCGLKGQKVTCEFCKNLFCLQHRHTDDHSCGEYEKVLDAKRAEKGVITQETKATIEALKNLVSTITTPSTKTATSKKKLSDKQRAMAAKVRLMKLKGTAKGPGFVPMSERIFFQIGEKRIFCGLDFTIARLAGLAECSGLATINDFPLEAESVIRELIDLGILINGDELVAL